MRFLFGLILAAGLALIVYPRVAAGVAHRPIGTWRVYEPTTGFTEARPVLKSNDAPVMIGVEMTTRAVSELPPGAILTITVSVGGRTVLARALDFSGAVGRDTNPQIQERIFHTEAGVIDSVEDGTYIFTLDRGDAEGVMLHAVDLVLSHGASVDARLQPIGFSLAAIGFIGLALTFRARAGGKPASPGSQPRPPRWGRGA
ncbi:MAG: hypothetical protein DIU65_01885 [Proteobacteria bacterium]|nr:MAG: hypothetical protein DIU65_01885 [Pseudomonadota bacterium]